MLYNSFYNLFIGFLEDFLDDAGSELGSGSFLVDRVDRLTVLVGAAARAGVLNGRGSSSDSSKSS